MGAAGGRGGIVAVGVMDAAGGVVIGVVGSCNDLDIAGGVELA